MNFNKLAKEIHAQNKAVGWWDNPDRCVFEALQLINTEIAEATEAERKDLMDDKLPHRKGGEVELADALIRLLDLAGAYGWDCDKPSGDELGDFKRMYDHKSIGAKHLHLSTFVCGIGIALEDPDDFEYIGYIASKFVFVVLDIASTQNYDVMAALHEKLEFNKTRPDHKRENRAKAHGKKF